MAYFFSYEFFKLCSVVAALGSGVAYSLVSAGLQGQPGNAITTAAGFALFQGVFFKVRVIIYILGKWRLDCC